MTVVEVPFDVAPEPEPETPFADLVFEPKPAVTFRSPQEVARRTKVTKGKPESPIAVILKLAIMAPVALLFVLCCSGVFTPRNNGPGGRQNRSVPRTGEIAVINDGSEESVAIAATGAAHDALMKVVVAKDEHGFNALVATGQVFFVPPNTKARVLDPGFLTYEVRILEGRHEGRAGFLATEFVRAP